MRNVITFCRSLFDGGRWLLRVLVECNTLEMHAPVASIRAAWTITIE